MAEQAGVSIDGDDIHIRNVRNFTYRTPDEFTPHYNDRHYKISELSSVDMAVSHWAGNHIAHVFLSFGFINRDYVAISIEIRRRRGQKYSSLAGFFRQYEMFYVVAEERDLIGQRVIARGEELYLYRLQINPEIQRNLLLSYLQNVEHLAEHPEFYNSLTNNCTTNIFRHANAGAKLVPFNWKVLASGYVDKFAYDLGVLDRSTPFETLKKNSLVSNNIPLSAPDYSSAIRANLPAMQS